MVKRILLCMVLIFVGTAASAKKSSAKNAAAAKKAKKKSKKSQFKFEALIQKAQDLQTGSLIITQNEKFLVENNWESPLTFYYVQGLTSSFVTLTLGSLMDEGKLQPEALVSQWNPEWTDNRGKIKVSDLLQHTSGFADDEKDPWYKNPDTWAWLKSQKPAAEPGSQFNFSGTNDLLLGYLIAKVTDGDAEALIKKKIFDPLKIQKWSWDKDKSGHPNTAGGLRLRNYDVLKIGNLLSQQGTWNHQKIISQSWLEQMQTPSEKNPAFGLNWWQLEQNGLKALYAVGHQGQFIVVVPAKNVVAIRLRTLMPVEQNKPEYDWNDFPKDVLQGLARP